MSRDADDLPLAAEFPAATDAQWRKLVDGVLKGARFDKLQSRNADGLTIEPLYPRAPDAAPVGARSGHALAGHAAHRPSRPGRLQRRSPARARQWRRRLVLVPAGAIGAHGYGLAPSANAVERALAGVHLDAGISIALEFSPHFPELPSTVAALVKRQGLSPAAVDIRFGLDPLGAFARHGRSSAPWRERPPRIAAIAADLSKRGFRGPFAVADGRVVHDAGGTEAQELAFALASAVAYLRGLEAGGIALDEARRMIAFRLTADADQFLTIAKFRAMRKLWLRVEASCGLAPAPAFVEAETAWRTMTRDDAYVNILRATIAVFSAGVGGADAITVKPFTAARGLPDRFARRVARNAQLVLLDEAGIAHVADPTAGAGWSEDLTGKLCRAAWSLFQEIEATGGIAPALEQGMIQKKVAAARKARERALADGDRSADRRQRISRHLGCAGARRAARDASGPPRHGHCEPLTPLRFAAPFEKPV